MKVTVTTAAELDLNSAVDFYESKPQRHGPAMVDEFDRAIDAIADAPRLRPLVEDPHPDFEAREYLIRRFKQRVIFVIIDEEAFVITVVHASRRLSAWHRRLDTLS